MRLASAKPYRPPAPTETLHARIDHRQISDLVHLARLLDSRFVIPGTRIRFGLDALMGLAPGIGDGASALVSLYIMARAKHLGAPDKLLAKMGWNVAIDTALGAVPIVGDLFDIAFKANQKNVALLLEHLGIER